MAVEKLLEDLMRSHEGLQHLHIEPTENNINIILDTLTTLKKAYAFVSSLQAAARQEKEEKKERPSDDDA